MTGARECSASAGAGERTSSESGSAEPARSRARSGSAEPARSRARSGSAEPARSRARSGSAEPARSRARSGSAEPARSRARSGSAEPGSSSRHRGRSAPERAGELPRDRAGKPPDYIRERVAADSSAGVFGGRVQTRFPPEPNGYLHFGHAKAICLAFGVAAENGGVCRLRFDDTNPTDGYAGYAAAIESDIAWLGFEPDGPALHASDYFEQLYEWAEHLTANGLAYVDDQDADTIAATRGDFSEPGAESPWRDRSPEESLRLLRLMRAGRFADGERVLRAKIDMAHPNMLMRDPVMYRIRRVRHFRTGDSWCIYPTYDWAHGQGDAIEGVTHSLCSLEFDAHRPLYDWFLDHLPLRGDRPIQIEFARLNLTHTITSKRRLAKLVDSGLVDGWDDPRMPTLRGMRRRGYPPEAIRAFCDHIGVSRVNGVHEIELLESFVRAHHNRWAPRRMAVLRPLEAVIHNWPDGLVEQRTAVNNPEDPSEGTRLVPLSGRLWVESEDFMLDPPRKFYRLAPGREVRLRAGYFLRCEDVDLAPDGRPVRLHCSYDPDTGGGRALDGRRVRATVHWVSAEHAVDGAAALYGRLLTAAVPGEEGSDPLGSYNPASRELLTGVKMEPALAATQPGAVVQFERLGYFSRDDGASAGAATGGAGTEAEAGAVANTSLIFHRTVGLRDEWANIQKRRRNRQTRNRQTRNGQARG